MTGLAAPAREPAAAGGRASGPILGRLPVMLSSAAAAALGVLPHVLHHAGPLAGAALFAGIAGSLLFGVLGLIAATPLLIRVRRRCGSWRRPLGALASFAAVFAVSTFVVEPAGHEAHH